jgi:S1-C subfamily serine protease
VRAKRRTSPVVLVAVTAGTCVLLLAVAGLVWLLVAYSRAPAGSEAELASAEAPVTAPSLPESSKSLEKPAPDQPMPTVPPPKEQEKQPEKGFRIQLVLFGPARFEPPPFRGRKLTGVVLEIEGLEDGVQGKFDASSVVAQSEAGPDVPAAVLFTAGRRDGLAATARILAGSVGKAGDVSIGNARFQSEAVALGIQARTRNASLRLDKGQQVATGGDGALHEASTPEATAGRVHLAPAETSYQLGDFLLSMPLILERGGGVEFGFVPGKKARLGFLFATEGKELRRLQVLGRPVNLDPEKRATDVVAGEKPAAPLTPRSHPDLKALKPAIPYLEGKRGSGTAFLVAKGILATNNHVLQDEYIDELRVRFISVEKPEARALPVKLLYRDRVRDLALLAVDSEHRPLPLATVKPEKGHLVAVIGHPSRFSGAVQELHAVTQGTLEGLFMRGREPWYHLKADAAPGNSGGPVIDRKTGEVLGVLTFGIREQTQSRPAFPRLPAANPRGAKPVPMDTFCIPASFVQEALNKVESARDRDKLVREVTAHYAAELITLQICAAQLRSAAAAQARVRSGGRFGKDEVTLEDYLDLHKRLMSLLKPAEKEVFAATSPVPVSTRRNIQALRQNYQQMYEMVRRPPKSVTTAAYVTQYNRLVNKHRDLVKVLFKELGLPDSVQVRLLD